MLYRHVFKVLLLFSIKEDAQIVSPASLCVPLTRVAERELSQLPLELRHNQLIYLFEFMLPPPSNPIGPMLSRSHTRLA
jgi:hypothetical protein